MPRRDRKKHRRSFHDPLKFQHARGAGKDNALLGMAREKLGLCTRFDGAAVGGRGEVGTGSGSSSGPYAYGWRSMPRQVYGDFTTRLSNDGRTINHPNAVDAVMRGPPVLGKVAYVLAVTSCYGDGDNGGGGDVNVGNRASPNHPRDEESFRDFAMMLRASVHANSHRNPASGSAYDYEMHAIIHPHAKTCRRRRPAIDASPGTRDDGWEGRDG